MMLPKIEPPTYVFDPNLAIKDFQFIVAIFHKKRLDASETVKD